MNHDKNNKKGKERRGIDYFCPALRGYHLGVAQVGFSFRAGPEFLTQNVFT